MRVKKGRGQQGRAEPWRPCRKGGFVQRNGKVVRVHASLLAELTAARCGGGVGGGFK